MFPEIKKSHSEFHRDTKKLERKGRKEKTVNNFRKLESRMILERKMKVKEFD